MSTPMMRLTHSYWMSSATKLADLRPLQSCLLDFEPEIMDYGESLYGAQQGAEAEAFAEHAMEDQGEALRYGPVATEVLLKAVEAERDRLRDFQRTPATTEQGKGLQRQLGGSGAYIDAVVDQANDTGLARTSNQAERDNRKRRCIVAGARSG